MRTASSQKRTPAAGQCFVVRALDRKGRTRRGAISLARRRIAQGGPGRSHTLLVVQVEAVVRLKPVPTIIIEKIKNPKSKR